MFSPPNPQTFNPIVWEIVRQIPEGRVSTYGQIASMIPPPPGVDELQYRRLSPRWVGNAMHLVEASSGVPWQRVINSKGEISLRGSGDGHTIQRHLLEAEGIQFDDQGRVNFGEFGWEGPNPDWLAEHRLLPPKPLDPRASTGPESSQPRLF